jgi:hypothetical protein
LLLDLLLQKHLLIELVRCIHVCQEVLFGADSEV